MTDNRLRLGLALGSGAARGFAHIGVLQALEQEGIAIDCIAGTSMGAVIGVLYAAGVSPDELADAARNLQWKQLAGLLDPVWPTSGLIDGNKVRRFIQALLPVDNFDQLRLPVAVTATDVQSGKPIIIRQGRLLDALQAAVAFPGIFNPVRFGDRWLIDGGLCYPVPTEITRDLGAERVISVCAIPQVEKPQETSLPPQPHQPGGGMADTFTARRIEQLFRDIWHGYNGNEGQRAPNIFRVAAQSIAIMENQINDLQLHLTPPDLLLRPSLPGLTLLEFHRAQEAIAAGRQETLAHLPALRQLTRQASGGPSPVA